VGNGLRRWELDAPSLLGSHVLGKHNHGIIYCTRERKQCLRYICAIDGLTKRSGDDGSEGHVFESPPKVGFIIPTNFTKPVFRNGGTALISPHLLDACLEPTAVTIVHVNHGNGRSPYCYLIEDYGKLDECGLVFSPCPRGRWDGRSPRKFQYSVDIALINGRYES
jgi:hypothetical protein